MTVTLAPFAFEKCTGARRLGFGVSGPHGSNLVSSRATEAIIRRAFELEVRLFDTAPSYGEGEAERRLGRAMMGLPRLECIISTKVGVLSSGARRVRDFSPDGVRRSLDKSLKRLQMRSVDWLFLHGPDPKELTDKLLNVLTQERYDGRVGMLGVAGRGSELDGAVATGEFRVFMAPVNAGLPQHSLDRLARIKASGAELIGIETLSPALPRYPLPTGRGAAWRLARALAGRTKGRPHLKMDASTALTWALSTGGAHRAVITTTRFARLEQNVATAIAAPPAA